MKPSQTFLTTMNSSMDFSYLDTPRTGTITNMTTIVPRQAQPNPRLPAYVDGALAWGGMPMAVSLLPTPPSSPLTHTHTLLSPTQDSHSSLLYNNICKSTSLWMR